jgi:hypothetical protein
MGGGHGLLAHVMLLLDNSSPEAIVVETSPPPSAGKIHEVMVDAWPRLAGRVTFVTAPMNSVDLRQDDVVVSCHACGALTDLVIERATGARARLAVLPCCHDKETCDAGPLAGWFDPSSAIDAMRAVRLQRQGYRVWTQTIPAAITPKNRLLLGLPLS